MPKGYVIARAAVTNATKWAEYAALATEAIKKYGGKPLARGGQVFAKGHSPQGKGLMARDHLLQLLRKIKLLHAPDC